MTTPTPRTPRHVRSTTLAAGTWLQLDRIEYVDSRAQSRMWEAAGRRHGQGAVVMIATLRPSNRYVLVQQYRPPVDQPVLEFPAGLIDAGERPEDTAVRELREETGYHGSVRWLSPKTYNSPGLSGEFAQFATMDVDETAPENQSPEPRLDDGEEIEVVVVAPSAIPELLAQRQADGVAFDGKVVAYFLGGRALP